MVLNLYSGKMELSAFIGQFEASWCGWIDEAISFLAPYDYAIGFNPQTLMQATRPEMGPAPFDDGARPARPTG